MSTQAACITWLPEGSSLYQLLTFDVVKSETHTATVEVTEHKVETGPNISDNVRINLDGVSLEVFVSNAPILTDAERTAMVGNDPSQYQLVNPYSGTVQAATLTVPVYNAPIPYTPGGLISAASNLATQVVSGRPKSNTRQVTANVLQFGVEFNAVADVLTILKNLINTSQLLTVTTSTQNYNNLLITSVSLSRDSETGTGAGIKIDFKQLRIVSSQTATAASATSATSATSEAKPSLPRAEPPESEGAQNPIEKDSFLEQGKNVVKGWLQ